MSHSEITAQPLSAVAFAPFGDVLDCSGGPDKLINAGLCGRYHDRAKLDFGDGRAGLSLFNAQPRSFPYTLNLMERHPEGSQAFIPMSEHPFLITVAPDQNGIPGPPQAFITAPGQAINIHRNIWHGVLTPLHAPGLFAVIDRIGDGPNLEEHPLHPPIAIHPSLGSKYPGELEGQSPSSAK
ncbi:MAG: ureidoglycolate lyase [Pseudomonadota bacterium]